MGIISDRSPLDLSSRLRLYGLRATAMKVLRALFRKVYSLERNIAFIILDFQGYEFHDPCISPLTAGRIERAAVASELDESQARLLNGFIEEGSRGVCAEVDGKLAGYAWVQFEGEYRFGPSGRLQIPSNHAIVKNLMVLPQYRGCKLGQKLNAARLAMIPAGSIPVVFIILENRFAIRNWEKLGFQRVIQVELKKWCGRIARADVRWLKRHPLAEALYQVIIEANCV
jgi:GNAT superfamily N-acetyltransferase